MLELRPDARAARRPRSSPTGIDLNYLNLPVEETFFRMLRHREFDVAEMSLSSYVVSLFTAGAAVHRHPGVSRRASSGIPAST